MWKIWGAFHEICSFKYAAELEKIGWILRLWTWKVLDDELWSCGAHPGVTTNAGQVTLEMSLGTNCATSGWQEPATARTIPKVGEKANRRQDPIGGNENHTGPVSVVVPPENCRGEMWKPQKAVTTEIIWVGAGIHMKCRAWVWLRQKQVDWLAVIVNASVLLYNWC